MHFGKSLLSKRIYAFTIDLAVIVFLQKSLINLYTFSFKQMTFFKGTDLSSQMEHPLETLLTTILVISYFTLSYYLFNGQSIGKTLFKMRVLSKDHVEMTLFESFARANGYFICLFPLSILFIIPFLTKSSRGIPDWLSRTEVVTEEFAAQLSKEKITTELTLQHAFNNVIPLSYEQDRSSANNDLPKAA